MKVPTYVVRSCSAKHHTTRTHTVNAPAIDRVVTPFYQREAETRSSRRLVRDKIWQQGLPWFPASRRFFFAPCSIDLCFRLAFQDQDPFDSDDRARDFSRRAPTTTSLRATGPALGASAAGSHSSRTVCSCLRSRAGHRPGTQQPATHAFNTPRPDSDDHLRRRQRSRSRWRATHRWRRPKYSRRSTSP